MANAWKDYLEKSKPADTDELMALDASATANKRVKFSGVWDWIVDKMATAVMSKLETQNKTLIGAVNELNSNWSSCFSEKWENCNGMSIFERFKPTDACGIYSCYNISDIPKTASALSAYVVIIKGVERMLVVTETNAYITASNQSKWNKKWREISTTLVS